uniref:Secreted protein n=1 Tax=Arundo donax TaxID=35708 RepID=A0A0A9HTH0_ARUDO
MRHLLPLHLVTRAALAWLPPPHHGPDHRRPLTSTLASFPITSRPNQRHLHTTVMIAPLLEMRTTNPPREI